jgi:hypothetical protein
VRRKQGDGEGVAMTVERDIDRGANAIEGDHHPLEAFPVNHRVVRYAGPNPLIAQGMLYQNAL